VRRRKFTSESKYAGLENRRPLQIEEQRQSRKPTSMGALAKTATGKTG
jgi:hypothetical protein